MGYVSKGPKEKKLSGIRESPTKKSENSLAQVDGSPGNKSPGEKGSPVSNVGYTVFNAINASKDRSAPSVPGINIPASGFGSRDRQYSPRFGQGELSNLKYSPGGIIIEPSVRSIHPKVQPDNCSSVVPLARVKMIFKNLKYDLEAVNPIMVQEPSMYLNNSNSESTIDPLGLDHDNFD